MNCLRQLRLDRGFSQSALAARAGVTTATICRAEIPGALPALRTARKIASALGVPLDTLV